MIPAMLRVMILGLLRDRGALAMAFLLPPLIFVIFAAIFSGVSGDAMELRVVLAIERNSAAAERLTKAMRDEPSLRFLPETLGSADAVARTVKEGAADVGLVVTGDLTDTTMPPITVLADPGKVMAGAILAGQVQRVLAKHLPDLGIARTLPAVESLVGGWTPEQSARLAAAMDQLASASTDQAPSLVHTSLVGPQGGSGATVTYYAGAVAILFLLFSAMQNAATLIEERHSGIIDRIAIGPSGTDVVVLGKWLFLTGQGMVQVALIFLVAALLYGVDVVSHAWLWFLTTLAAAAAASGLGLAVASTCTSRQQAQTISTFVVLVCSAIGGSMVPRFMMPPWLQDAGWYTPNAWAIEAYHGVLWRGEGLLDLLPELGWLWACALGATALALIVSRKRLRM
jgi:ABC-2 type transport system permease protein